MNIDKNPTTVEESAKQVEQVEAEAEARAEADGSTYTHVFKNRAKRCTTSCC